MERSDHSLSVAELLKQFSQTQLRPLKTVPTDAPEAKDLTASARYVIRESKKRLGQHFSVSGRSNPDEDELYQLIRQVEEGEGEELSEKERTTVAAALTASFDHYDVLTPLVENPEVNDIIIRRFDDISIQSNRRNLQTDLRFPDQDAYRSFVENLLKRAGKACTIATPVVDAAVDPHVRACVTHESFSPTGSGPMLTLRIARHRSISLEGLAHYELAPREVLSYLAAIVESGCGTLLVAGEVGTGKTTLIKALSLRIPEEEAILIIEDTHELVLNRKFVRTLLTREANTEGSGRISPAMAIRAGMRMAMNRLVLGEMRDAEAAEAFVDVCASGHSGMSTIHARSAKDALARLELFLSRAQSGVGIDTVRRQVANAVSTVIFLGLDKATKKRRIMEVTEVGSFVDGSMQLSPIYRYNRAGGKAGWIRESGVSAFQEFLRDAELQLSDAGTILTLESTR